MLIVGLSLTGTLTPKQMLTLIDDLALEFAVTWTRGLRLRYRKPLTYFWFYSACFQRAQFQKSIKIWKKKCKHNFSIIKNKMQWHNMLLYKRGLNGNWDLSLFQWKNCICVSDMGITNEIINENRTGIWAERRLEYAIYSPYPSRFLEPC